jgi:hypothetical protein
MKPLKKLSFGLAATALLSGSAFAQTIVHVVGSTAFRPGATAAIIDVLNGSSVSNIVQCGFVGTSTATVPLNAGEAIFANGTLSGGATTPVGNPGVGTATIVVETYWTGSLAGVVDVSLGNATGTFLDFQGTHLTPAQIDAINNSTAIGSSNQYGGTISTSGVSSYPANSTQAIFATSGTGSGVVTLVPEAADMALSDTDVNTIANELYAGSLNSSGGYTSIPAQGSFPGQPAVGQPGSPYYANPQALANNLSSLVTEAGSTSATAGYVGIVPFVWASDVAGSSIATNMTQLTALSLLTTGYIPQAAFTGTTTNSGDLTNYFYLVGRNEDSGTRIGAVTESQYSLTSSPHQYAIPGVAIPEPTFSSPSTTVTPTAYEKFPAKTPLNTEPSIVFGTAAAQSGYASGGNVGTALKTTATSFTFATSNGGKAAKNSGSSYLIGYIGIADVQTALIAGAKEMTYNGVPYTVPNVQSGAYTFWGYEHAYRNTAAGTGPVQAFIDSVADEIYTTDANVSTASGILPSTVKANIASPGGPLTY